MKFLTFLFSQVGITCLVVAYSIAGGFLFQALEADAEQLTRAGVSDARAFSVDQLWNATLRLLIDRDLQVEQQHEWLTQDQQNRISDKQKDVLSSFESPVRTSSLITDVVDRIYNYTTKGTTYLNEKEFKETVSGYVKNMKNIVVRGLFDEIIKASGSQEPCQWNTSGYQTDNIYSNWTARAQSVIQVFQDSVYSAVKDQGWDGRDESHPDVQWSFAGSLLYSVTIITTIGYGHISPKTPAGRVVTIFYAVVGIPLTLLCLANIGEVFASCFRFMYKHFSNCMVFIFCKEYKRGSPRRRKPLPKSNSSNKTQDAGDLEKGGGDPSTVMSRDADNPAHDLDATPPYFLKEEAPPPAKRAENSGDEPVRVPLFVSFMVITLYIFAGAVLFSTWEEDWDYLESSYFCFITLSTIGFGDFVFGVDDLENQEKLIICAMYLTLGLSILAMTFNLMQEEVKAKFVWLGKKLGILEEDG